MHIDLYLAVDGTRRGRSLGDAAALRSATGMSRP